MKKPNESLFQNFEGKKVSLETMENIRGGASTLESGDTRRGINYDQTTNRGADEVITTKQDDQGAVG